MSGFRYRFTILSIIFCVTYYLELHNTIFIYYTSHILLKIVKLVVWILTLTNLLGKHTFQY